MKLLNLGCGASYHSSWINIDFVSTGPGVIAHNLLSGIPFPDHSFDAVYHSHILEHFTKEDACDFIAQCYRVLKPGGVLRIVVPDLEGIVRSYLMKLEECIEGKSGAEDDYDWILLELFDQMVRKESGGAMKPYLFSGKNKKFVFERIGHEAVTSWGHVDRPVNSLDKFRKISLSKIIRKLRVALVKIAVRLIGGKAFLKSFEEGMFRNSGEPHMWMYDRYSLRRLLEESGFINVKMCAPDESRIAEFEKYSLDVSNDAVRKPDSLFIEASKP